MYLDDQLWSGGCQRLVAVITFKVCDTRNTDADVVISNVFVPKILSGRWGRVMGSDKTLGRSFL